MHTRGAKKAGETDERLFTVAAWRDAPYFTDAERAALALTEAGTRLADRADPVPDAVFDEAAKHYDEQSLAALIVCIASINTWNRLNVITAKKPGNGRLSGPAELRRLTAEAFRSSQRSTLNVKLWVTTPAELVAVMVSRSAVLVAAVGVPAMVAVPFPLLTKLTPAGRPPASVRVGTG